MQSLQSDIRIRRGDRRDSNHQRRSSFRPSSETMEPRLLLSFADGNGPVVTSLIETLGQGGASLVVSFDGPLNPGLAQRGFELQSQSIPYRQSRGSDRQRACRPDSRGEL